MALTKVIGAGLGTVTDNADFDGTLNVQGETTLQTHLNMGDNDIIKLGAGNDFEVFSDGSNGVLKAPNLDLYLQSDSKIRLTSEGNSETLAIFNKDGAVELYHDNSKKLETVSDGINITGGVRLGGNNAANELDDYEEGTWTPALTGLTLSTALGNYTKIGQIVHWGLRVVLPTTTANTHFNVTGLPFSHSLSSDYRFGGALIYANHNIGADVTCIVVNNGVQFYKNGSTFVEYGDYNGKDVRASGAYITTD